MGLFAVVGVLAVVVVAFMALRGVGDGEVEGVPTADVVVTEPSSMASLVSTSAPTVDVVANEVSPESETTSEATDTRTIPTRDEWRTFTTADGLADDSVRTIAVAEDGALWFGTDGGASRFEPGG